MPDRGLALSPYKETLTIHKERGQRNMKSDLEKTSSYDRIQKHKIVLVENLEVGMFVSKLDRPWSDTPFVFQGFLLQTEEDIASISKYCDWVYIDVAKFIHFVGKKSSAKTNKLKYLTYSAITIGSETPRKSAFSGMGRLIHRSDDAKKKSRSFIESLKPAVEAHRHTGELVKSMMEGVKLGKSIDIPAAKDAVAACVDSVMDNKDAMLLLTRLRNIDEYTSEHSLNVAILSIAFGHHVGMGHKQLNEIGLCGLLHDMGMMLIPSDVLNKPGRLTDEEMALIRKHPVDGREILLATNDVRDDAVDVAYCHHERLNGTGYPRGIAGKELSRYTRMVAIADVFDAITGNRVYSRCKTAEEALSITHKDSAKLFDTSLVIDFIENIGTYPLGTIVETHNGEVGIIVGNNPSHRLRPRIKMLLDEEKQPLAKAHIIDLGKAEKDSEGHRYMIKTSHNSGSFDVDLTQHIKSYAQKS